jgi:hypothetical protein
VGKVCDLCRGLETSILAVLTVKHNLGILFDERYSGYVYVDGLIMMAILMISGTFLFEEVFLGYQLVFYDKTWLLLMINTWPTKSNWFKLNPTYS